MAHKEEERVGTPWPPKLLGQRELLVTASWLVAAYYSCQGQVALLNARGASLLCQVAVLSACSTALAGAWWHWGPASDSRAPVQGDLLRSLPASAILGFCGTGKSPHCHFVR